jgi:hypothetical protein
MGEPKSLNCRTLRLKPNMGISFQHSWADVTGNVDDHAIWHSSFA